MKDFLTNLKQILPEFSNGNYGGKRLELPFGHETDPVELSPIELKQKLPGETFQLSYFDCMNGGVCMEHVERMQNIVRTCYQEAVNKDYGGLSFRFGKILIRKQIFTNEPTIGELVQKSRGYKGPVKVNIRHQYMKNDDSAILDVFYRLGATKQSEEKKIDDLKFITSQNLHQTSNTNKKFGFSVHLDPGSMMLSKIMLGTRFAAEYCIPFPSSHYGTEKVFGGCVLRAMREREISPDELSHMCNDEDLLSILEKPGLGFLSKMQDGERFEIPESCIDTIDCLVVHRDCVCYSFDLNGVQIVVNSFSGVHHNFEREETESKVHQVYPGRDIRIEFTRNDTLPIDDFVTTVARVLLAVKDAVRDGRVKLAMYEVKESIQKRIDYEVQSYSPSWTINKQSSRRDPTFPLRRVRDGGTLEEMLGVSGDVHTIVLKSAVRKMLHDIEEIGTRWSPRTLELSGLDPNGRDLSYLKKKLLDAAVVKNIFF